VAEATEVSPQGRPALARREDVAAASGTLTVLVVAVSWVKGNARERPPCDKSAQRELRRVLTHLPNANQRR
jgi:hypothetical protein